MDNNWLYSLLSQNTADPLVRLKLGNVILNEVSQRKISPHPKLVNDFLDVMSQWLSGSNFKVSTIGLEIMDAALRMSPEVLASYYFDRISILIERAGDSKQQVRDMAVNLLLQLAYLENSSPVMLVDRLCISGTGFEHKQWLVRVAALIILRDFLNTSFALVIQQAMHLLPQICKLTNDPNSEVRDAATNVIVDLMVFGGTTIISRITATKLINEQKMAMLMQRYQTTLSTRGDLPPKHTISMETASPQRNSLIRRSLRSPAKIAYGSTRLSTPPRSSITLPSASSNTPSPLSTPTLTTPPSILNNSNNGRSRDMGRGATARINGNASISVSRLRSSSTAPGACAVSQDDFRKAFTAVPKTTIFSDHDVYEKLSIARTLLSNPNEDWSKRANQLKLIRSIVINSEDSIDKRRLISSLNELSDALELSISDLRSQIVREAAVTCSFLFETFGLEMRSIAETVLPAALAQVSVSTKVLASSAATLTTFIVQKVPTRQVFTIISDLTTSKAREQRKHLSSLLEIIISQWDHKTKQPFIRQIAQMVKNAVCDADGETRVAGRKAFVKLEQFHSDVADQIFRELDSSKQKLLREGAASSSSSLNSDRDNSKTVAPNISQKFLAQRSASAVDAKQIVLSRQIVQPTTSIPRPNTVSKLPKSSTSTSFSAIRSSGYGNGNGLRSKTPNGMSYYGQTSSPTSANNKSNSSSPSTSTIQTPIQRVASNLGSTSFVASLTQEQAFSLQKVMDDAKDEMNKQNNEEDEFLLSTIKATTPPRASPPSSHNTSLDHFTITPVEHILKGCMSSSSNEKKEAIKMLSTILNDPNLVDSEIKQIGDTLTRLLAEGNTTLLIPILETISIFVRIHFEKLNFWLKMALGKLFTKIGAESLPNVRSALLSAQKSFLVSFDPAIQLKAVCEFMCDPIHLLVPKARLALLEYLCILLEEIWPDDPRYLHKNSSYDAPYTRTAIRKMFGWMFDQRNGTHLMSACERLVCALFALNAADFTLIFNDLTPECRDWAHRILQLNGQSNQRQIEKETISSNNNYKAYSPQVEEEACLKSNYPTYEHSMRQIGRESRDSPVRTYRQTPPINDSYNSPVEIKRSTAHLATNLNEQSIYIRSQLDSMRNFNNPNELNDSMAKLHGLMCEGAFTLWNQYFDELLDTIYQILSTISSDIRKKLALRILMKMCNAQASKLFDSTEIAISKVLHAAVSSDDNTMSVVAEDCLRTLGTHLPLPRVIQISRRVLSQDDDARSVLILKMLTRMFQEIDIDELALILDDMAPCFVQAYESPSSSVRKCAVYGLVALVQRSGQQRMAPHLRTLNPSKLNLIELYVDRARSSESGSART